MTVEGQKLYLNYNILSTVFSRECNQKEQVSENGPQVVSSKFKIFVQELLCIENPYSPQTNREIEETEDALQIAHLTRESKKLIVRHILIENVVQV